MIVEQGNPGAPTPPYNMASLLEDLNPEQRAAVVETEGPLLILAGAGSGKTRVITYRVAYLIEARGVSPGSILAVTFTNKAADQMKERVAALLARRGVNCERPPLMATFHSFCVRVLRRDSDRLGYSRDFSIYDDDDQLRLVKASIKELGLEQQITSPRAALGRISYHKNSGITPQELYREASDAETARLASVFDRYERKLVQASALDFDDLLLKAVELLDKAPDVRQRYNERFRYILVDEYQDTNRAQYQLIRQLTGEQQNLCVVGDEDQSIYRWRGATIENILRFEQDYPGARIIRLEQNYRSTQVILDAAGALVSRNKARKGKTLWTDRRLGDSIGLIGLPESDRDNRSLVFLSQRLVSCKLEPRRHPLPSDTTWRLARCGVAAALGRSDLALGFRVLYAAWFLAMVVAPRRASTRLAEQLLFPESRGVASALVDRLQRRS